MFDFLITHNHTENPTALGILITVLCSFLLASLIAMTYLWTTSDVDRSNNLLQSMVLVAIVSAMVMQAIGDSLARGLGMLGALAIIRFRTKLDNPRNMAFVFGALANGIACGVYGFTIAFIGTFSFCLAAIVLKLSRLGIKETHVGQLVYRSKMNFSHDEEIHTFLKKNCRHLKLISEQYLNLSKTKTIKGASASDVKKVRTEIYKQRKFKFSVSNADAVDKIAVYLDKIEGIKNVSLKLGEQNDKL